MRAPFLRLPDAALLDGGVGTALLALGLSLADECPEAWNVTRPDAVRAVHASFFAAGSDLVQTNTFGGSRARLLAAGCSLDVRAVNLAGALIAREARPSGKLVAGSMGPSGLVVAADARFDADALADTFAEQAAILAEGGVDLLHLETLAHPGEARAALRGARAGAPGLPIVASMCCRRTADGGYETLFGFRPEEMIEAFVAEGASAVGANCLLGPTDMVGLVTRLRAASNLPVIAKPARAENESGEAFGRSALALFRAGAAAVGGCCGVVAADIAAVRRALDRSG